MNVLSLSRMAGFGFTDIVRWKVKVNAPHTAISDVRDLVCHGLASLFHRRPHLQEACWL